MRSITSFRDRTPARLLIATATTTLVCAAWLAAGAQAVPALAAGGQAEPATGPGLLYAHEARSGTFKRSKQRWSVYVLTLRGVEPKALWFEDRPGRREGVVQIQRMLDGFFGKPGEEPPNAAISVHVPGSDDQVLMGVELVAAKYDRAKRTLRYWVRELDDEDSAPMGVRGGTDERLPARFGHASVFIDDTFLNECIGVLTRRGATNRDEVGTPDQLLAVKTADKATHDTWGAWTFAGDLVVGLEGGPAPGAGLPFDTPYEGIAPFTKPTADWRSQVWGWHTESGLFSGCSNVVWFTGPYGAIRAGVNVPWIGSNSYACQATGRYRCRFVQATDFSTNAFAIAISVISMTGLGPYLPPLGAGVGFGTFEWWVEPTSLPEPPGFWDY
jgi:hypothetical protein